jgi:hypothetical protein
MNEVLRLGEADPGGSHQGFDRLESPQTLAAKERDDLFDGSAGRELVARSRHRLVEGRVIVDHGVSIASRAIYALRVSCGPLVVLVLVDLPLRSAGARCRSSVSLLAMASTFRLQVRREAPGIVQARPLQVLIAGSLSTNIRRRPP